MDDLHGISEFFNSKNQFCILIKCTEVGELLYKTILTKSVANIHVVISSVAKISKILLFSKLSIFCIHTNLSRIVMHIC